MSRRTRIAISAACAALVVLICALYARHVRDESERARTEAMERYGGEVVSLVVASRDIEAGEVVGSSDVRARDWLYSLAPEHALMTLDDVLGREVTVPVSSGVPLTELNFRDASLMADVPSGRVAVSIPITDRLGIPLAVSVGSRVQMYRAHEDGAEPLGSDAIVMAAPGTNGVLSGQGTLAIAVMANDVSQVLAASTSGDLRLVVPAQDVKEQGKAAGAADKGKGVNVEPEEAEKKSPADEREE